MPADEFIPFNRFCAAGPEFDYIRDAFNRSHVAGGGPYTARCEQVLAELLGAHEAILTTSGTAALELAGLLLDLAPGDEVILPSFTFVSTANAFVLRGARPVFADVRPDTLNLDETKLEALLTPRTRAIVAVHYAGVGCEIDAIGAIAARAGVTVIEDNAHGLFGRYRGRPLGSFGALAAHSFHETKNISCGEGGALAIHEAALSERAAALAEKGTDRRRFLRGEVARYTWVDVGSSFLPSEILAAILYAQLEARERIQDARRRLWRNYAEGLAGWAAESGVGLPAPPPHCDHPAHLFHLILPSRAVRDRFIAALGEQGILSVFHYQPLHLSKMGRRFGGQPGDCPVTERAGDCLVRLPLFNGMSEGAQARVLAAVRGFRV